MKRQTIPFSSVTLLLRDSRAETETLFSFLVFKSYEKLAKKSKVARIVFKRMKYIFINIPLKDFQKIHIFVIIYIFLSVFKNEVQDSVKKSPIISGLVKIDLRLISVKPRAPSQ